MNVRFADEDVWLSRENLAEIYATTPQNISLHIGNIYQDMELSEEGTRKKFFLVWKKRSMLGHCFDKKTPMPLFFEFFAYFCLMDPKS